MTPEPHKKAITLDSDPCHLQSALKELAPFLQRTGFPEKTVQSLLVALGEAATNASRHSYCCEKGRPIEITLEDSSEKLVVRLRDFGKKIDLAGIKEPTLPPVKGGGLGIYFMRTIMDDLKYNTAHAEGNELIMTKYKRKETHDENPDQEK